MRMGIFKRWPGGSNRRAAGVLILLSGLGLTSCDPAPTPPPKGPPNDPAPPPTASAAEASIRQPDRVLLDVIPQDAVAAGWLDFAWIRAQPDWMTVLQALPPAAAILGWSRRCGFDVLQALDDSLFAWTKAGAPFIALKLGAIQDAQAAACLVEIAGGPESAVSVAGRSGARMSKDLLFVVRDGVALMGTQAALETAFARMDAPPRERAPVLAKLPRGPSTFLSAAGMGVRLSDMELTGAVELAQDKLAVALDVGTPSAADASELRARAQQGIDRMQEVLAAEAAKAAAEGGEPERLALAGARRLAESITVQQEGNRVLLGLGLKGSAAEVTAALGTVSAVAIHGVRSYLASAKASEARSTVAAIARALHTKVNSDIEAETKKKGGKASRVKFPASTGLTPPVVPSGQKFIPGTDTWSHPTWKAIGFRMEVPLYYSYEIDVSKDGKEAVVRARGDLDADGVQSKFEMPLKLSPDGQLLVGTEGLVENELE